MHPAVAAASLQAPCANAAVAKRPLGATKIRNLGPQHAAIGVGQVYGTLPTSSAPRSTSIPAGRAPTLGEPCMLDASAALDQGGGAELFKMKKAKGTLAIEVEHAKVIGFVQVPHGNIEVSAIAFFRQIDRQLIGNELLDALRAKFIEKARVR
jgi:hypothetical protein